MNKDILTEPNVKAAIKRIDALYRRGKTLTLWARNEWSPGQLPILFALEDGDALQRGTAIYNSEDGVLI